MTSQSREHLHWKDKPFPELVRLAWPIAVSMLSYSVMTLVDTLFVGRLGASALAGVSVGGTTAFTLLCFGWGLLRSVKVLVSQAVGAGRGIKVAAIVGAGLFLAVAFGAANMAIGWLLSPELGRVMATDASALAARSYLDVRVVGAPLFLVAAALREARYGLGDARSPMRAAVAANFANVGLDYLFIYVLGWGVSGAAWASVLGHGVDVALLVVIHFRRGTESGRGLAGFGLGRMGLAQIRAVWRIGLPLGGQMTLEVLAFAVLTAMFASMSELDVAAHQIALQVLHFSFLPALAIGEAASILVGQAVGANRDELVRPLARRTLLLTAGYTGVGAAVYAIFAWPIAAAFSNVSELQQLTVQLLYVAAAFQVFDGANIVGRCVLRGTGDVRWPAVVNVACAWLITPPLTLALGYGLELGVFGGWLGFCGEIVLGASLLWWRLERSHWRTAARRSREDLEREDAPPSSRPVPVTS